MAAKVPMAIKVLMVTKVPTGTKISLAVLASYEIWACLLLIMTIQQFLKNSCIIFFEFKIKKRYKNQLLTFRKSVKKRNYHENPKKYYLSRTRRLPGCAKPVRASLRSPNGNCSHFPHMTRSISLKNRKEYILQNITQLQRRHIHIIPIGFFYNVVKLKCDYNEITIWQLFPFYAYHNVILLNLTLKEKWGHSDYSFMHCQGFIGALNKKNF